MSAASDSVVSPRESDTTMPNEVDADRATALNVARRIERRAIVPGVAVAIGALWQFVFATCLCGHFSGRALPLNLMLTAVTVWQTHHGRDARTAVRATLVLTCLWAVLLLLKNLVDVLWVGHDPWFR